MNKRIIKLFFLVIMLFLLISCAKKEVEASNSSRKTLDWAGTYCGVVPNYDNLGTYIELELNEDLTFTKRVKKQGTSDELKTVKGTITWSKDGNSMVLDSYAEVESSVLLVKKDMVQWKKINEIEFDDELVENNTLAKSPKDLLGKEWIITRIYNEFINVRPTENNEYIYLTFSKEENKVNGFGGCNYFMVYYHMINNDIKFMPIRSTNMTGPNIDIEKDLFDVLSKTRKYEIIDNELYLSDEKGIHLLVANAVTKKKK